MTAETMKCGVCGASVPQGMDKCGECNAALHSGVSIKSGGILARLGAGLVDVLVLSSFLAVVIIEHLPWWSAFIGLALFIGIGYLLYGSLGKSLFGLSVEVTPRARYYIRETVGKLASTVTFGIGFLMMFSNDGLALHDLIAKSSVVRIQRNSPAIQGIRTLLLVAAVGIVAFLGAKFGTRVSIH